MCTRCLLVILGSADAVEARPTGEVSCCADFDASFENLDSNDAFSAPRLNVLFQSNGRKPVTTRATAALANAVMVSPPKAASRGKTGDHCVRRRGSITRGMSNSSGFKGGRRSPSVMLPCRLRGNFGAYGDRS